MELILAFFAWIGIIEREKPPPPPKPVPPVARLAAPEKPARDPSDPSPPSPLPPARGCREALAQVGDPLQLPGRIDGDAIHGVAGLERLRAASGDALLVVKGGDFSGAPFGGRRLRNFCFYGTKFTGSDWREARTSGVGFIHADFSGAWLDRSRMRGLVLDSVILDGASALGADWRGGVLQGGRFGSLKQVRLDGADLRGFRVNCAGGMDSACVSYWGDISLRGADLRSASVDTLRSDVDWTGARLAGTRIALRQLAEIGPARRAGTLIVRSGDVEVPLSPAEFVALQPFVHRNYDRHENRRQGRPSWMRPGTTALFVATAVRFDPAFRRTSLYRRLVPALAADPQSRMLVKVRRDGRIDVEGDATGGADHMCGLQGEGLRLDRATGWHSGPQKPYEGDPPEWRGRPMPVLRFRGDWAEAHHFSHRRDPRTVVSDYITCGARAGFEEMIRLPLTSAEASRWYKATLR